MTRLPESIWIVIPARNEAASIGRVVAAARTQVQHVLVVDDASDDDTSTVAASNGAQILSLAHPLGAWGAIQAGLRYVVCRGGSTVVTIDADGQHPVEEIGALLAPLRSAEADVTIGADPGRVSRKRQLAWEYLRRLTHLGITDLTSGYRAYGERALKVLGEPEATLLNYQDIGVLLMLRDSQLRILEVSVSMAPREHGISRIFSSWPRVLIYLLESTVIGIANLGKNTHVDLEPNAIRSIIE